MVGRLRLMHAGELSVRLASKIHKKMATHEMIKISGDEEPGPSRMHGKCNISMSIHLGTSGKPVMWSQVAVLKSTMHNTVERMQAMEECPLNSWANVRNGVRGCRGAGKVGRDEGGLS